jgi:hypothetical protein
VKKYETVDRIKKHFGYLFMQYGFKVYSEAYFYSFGNWAVVLLSDHCRVVLWQDRGQVFVDLGPPQPSPNWQAGPLRGLDFLIGFLTKGKETFEYEYGDTDEQLKRLAQVLRVYLDQICEAFHHGVFEQDNDALKQFAEYWNEQSWDRLKNKGVRRPSGPRST